MLCYDDPDLVMEMVTHLATLTSEVIERAGKEIKIDYASGWEDMCFNNGPIISPTMVRKFLTPNYKRITDKLRPYGCDIIYPDCDGNINDMMDAWVAGGVDGTFPCDVPHGSEPVAIRKELCEKVGLLDGGDPYNLSDGNDATPP